MNDRVIGLLIWSSGFSFFVLAIPFLPRRQASTPLQAIGMAAALAAVWPLLLLVLLIKYAPLWYLLKWTEYLEFLTATKAQALEATFQRQWDPDYCNACPERYNRSKDAHRRELDILQVKGDRLYSRRLQLQEKLRNFQ